MLDVDETDPERALLVARESKDGPLGLRGPMGLGRVRGSLGGVCGRDGGGVGVERASS